MYTCCTSGCSTTLTNIDAEFIGGELEMEILERNVG
jgi:hypothetical protein